VGDGRRATGWRLVRTAVAGVVAGVVLVGGVWAGVVAGPGAPFADRGALPDRAGDPSDPPVGASAGLDGPAEGAGAEAGGPEVGHGLLVGVAKTSIAPRPEDHGGRWETDPKACRTLDVGILERLGSHPEDIAHLVDTGSPWPENPNCIYQGGFGLGPMNPVRAFDTELGLWVRALAVSDGTYTIVLAVVDGEGWLWDYARKCARCGAKQIGADLGAELGIDPAGIVVAATHSHASPDFIGGWGFVPDWYMTQVADSIRSTIRDAVHAMEPAVVEVGESQARRLNRERRDTYHSAEEQQMGWLRAYVPTGEGPRVIATMGAYAAHPVTKGTNDGVAHPDWVGEFEKGVEDRFGGMGFHFMTGLGNMSPAGDVAAGLVDSIPDVGRGRVVTVPDVSAVRRTWLQPVTNVPLTALGLPGFFDRRFQTVPSTVSVGKGEMAPCVSASLVSVEVPAAVLRIGADTVITTGPGELFSNLTNTIKERTPERFTMSLSQANDALGYIPQSFELNPVGQQGLGFLLSGFLIVNYEDSYAVDRCFGDAVLHHTMEMIRG